MEQSLYVGAGVLELRAADSNDALRDIVVFVYAANAVAPLISPKRVTRLGVVDPSLGVYGVTYLAQQPQTELLDFLVRGGGSDLLSQYRRNFFKVEPVLVLLKEVFEYGVVLHS